MKKVAAVAIRACAIHKELVAYRRLVVLGALTAHKLEHTMRKVAASAPSTVPVLPVDTELGLEDVGQLWQLCRPGHLRKCSKSTAVRLCSGARKGRRRSEEGIRPERARRCSRAHRPPKEPKERPTLCKRAGSARGGGHGPGKNAPAFDGGLKWRDVWGQDDVHTGPSPAGPGGELLRGNYKYLY